MKYYIHTDLLLGTIIIRDGNTWIPCDPSNADYSDYLAWVENGNQPEPWGEQQ